MKVFEIASRTMVFTFEIRLSQPKRPENAFNTLRRMTDCKNFRAGFLMKEGGQG
jgi:hypothetical protein